MDIVKACQNPSLAILSRPRSSLCEWANVAITYRSSLPQAISGEDNVSGVACFWAAGQADNAIPLGCLLEGGARGIGGKIKCTGCRKCIEHAAGGICCQDELLVSRGEESGIVVSWMSYSQHSFV